MSAELWLVRHAMPDVRPTVPPHRWQLSRAGRRSARALRDVLPGDAYAVASAEPKAIATLREAGYDPVGEDEGFGEVRRVEAYEGDFRQRRRDYLDGDDRGDWEARTEVVRRFEAALTRARLAAGGRPIVVGTHGMAMTLWLARRQGLARPSLLWDTLEVPDVVRIEP